MWESLLTILIGFLLTGVIGNHLLHNWQHRNWINQRRIERATDAVGALKVLLDQITQLADTRNFRMRLLCRRYKTASEDELIQLRAAHDQSVAAWNDNWNTFCTGLTFYAEYYYVERLEQDIQGRFVDAASLLSKMLSSRSNDQGAMQIRLENELNGISGATFTFSRDLLRLLIEKQEKAYQDPEVIFIEANLTNFSTIALIKRLFIPIK